MEDKLIWNCEKCPKYRAGTNVCCWECNNDNSFCADVEPIKQIFWVSRHEMTEEQFNALKKIYGEFDIRQINKTIESVQELAPYLEYADVWAVVLPPTLIAELMKITNKPIIYAVNGRELTTDGKAEFIFKGWRKYNKVVIETEDL